MARHILTLRCPDRPGIVRAVAEGIVACGGNIVDSAQFADPPTALFCLRTSFDADVNTAAAAQELAAATAGLDATIEVVDAARRPRVLVMVSRLDHCLVDLLYRCETGELPVDIAAVVSNHPDLEPVARRHGVEFRHVPVDPDGKDAAEAELDSVIADRGVDLVVLARYMQVLSDGFCARHSGRIINIHHSFLPGFKGGRPYHQAYERGVKLIGATAHYVTADLDEGPIIEQDVVRVSHSRTPADLVTLGRDVERRVLARAVALHAESRVVLVGGRTVVFDA